MEHLASRRKLWYAISLLVIIPGVVSLLLTGLKLGIDFTGGTLWDLRFDKPVATEQVKTVLARNGFVDSTVQLSNAAGGTDNVALIRIKELKVGSPLKTAIERDFTSAVGPFVQQDISSVGPSVGNSIRNRSILAVAISSVGILLYIAYAFRNTQNPLLYGICAVVAMLHDVLVVLGIFSILGWAVGTEVNALFVTALLTVIGFSVHDTIVVFDRIRENLAKKAAPTFEAVVDYSLAQTIVRSLNTSLTVTLTLLALYLFGGTSTRDFVLALLIGVVSGTYSSVFNASQLLVSWENGEIGHLFGRLRRNGGAEVAPGR
ncbi:MAG: protein translocase subunit SecF [Thermomicrobiales bacterium]